MSVDPLAFLDQPEGQAEQAADPLSFLDKSTSSIRKPARLAAQAGKGALNLNPLVAGYNLLTTSVREGAHKSRTRVSEQAQKDLQRMDEKLANGEPLTRTEKRLYDRTKQLAARKSEKAAGIDTESLINKGVKATTGVNLEPEDLGEEIANIGAGLVSPRGAVKAIQSAPKLFTSAGRATLSAERAAGKIQSGWASLGKAVKGNAEKEGLLNFAQKQGLSPDAATLLTQSEGKIDKLGKIAKKTKRFKSAAEELKKKLGSNYEKLKSIGNEGGYLGPKSTEALASDLRKMSSDMNKTLIKGPDTKAAQNAIEEALLKLETEGATIGDLVNTRINLGQQINWKNIDPKGAMLNEGRNVFLKAIERRNPRVANELRMTDKAWSQYEKYSDILDKKQAFMRIKGIEIPAKGLIFDAAAILGAKALLGMNLATGGKIYAAKEVVQRLSTALLVNPKFQGIRKKLMESILKGNTEKQRRLMILVQKMLKTDDPELYDELGLD